MAHPRATRPVSPRHALRLLPMIFIAILACTLAARADPPEKENQSVMLFRGGTELTSSALIKLLNETFQGKYQDLELVFSVCESGEFATRAASKTGGLQGNWSVTTSTDTEHCDTTTPSGPGKPDKKVGGKDGLKVKDSFYDGWLPQYVKKLIASPVATNKQLSKYATENVGTPDQNPQYASSGKAADDMTVHGGNKSNDAIIVDLVDYTDITGAMIQAMKDAGYAKSGSLATPKSLGGLRRALATASADVKKDPNNEKIYIGFSTHGSYGEKTVAYAPGRTGQAGGGAVVSTTASTIDIYADSPILIAGLEQDLPKIGGGYWAHDPTESRGGPAVLSFSTLSEDIATATSVPLTLDGFVIGDVAMGNPGGSDYQIAIPDSPDHGGKSLPPD